MSQNTKEELCKYLQVIGTGNFAASGPLSTPTSPGLFVHGVGKVGLPLSERDAAEIVRASHQAPFGKGSDTFIDTTIRNTLELNADQFELRNPAWTSTLQETVQTVAEELGVIDGSSNVRAELYKLLLYEPGAFFEKHRDTEKAPGMFATLAISLPSEHTGGDVFVKHQDEQKVLKTQGISDYDYTYLAWYADVNHSVSKVLSGHRLVLTYNLMHQTRESGGGASILDNHKQNIDKALQRWHQQDRVAETTSNFNEERMVYILEHEYSQANLSLDQLKGKDMERVRYLSESCRDSGFCLFLAHFQYSQFGSVDGNEDDPYWAEGADIHEFLDELDSSWKLPTIFEPTGQYLAKDIEMEEDELITDPDFDDIEPDDEECDDWTGNEGCTATHFYHRTCVVILPRNRRLEFLREAGNVNVELYISTLLTEMKDESLCTESRDELKRLCEAIIEARKAPEKARKEPAEDSYYSTSYRTSEPEIKGLSRVSDKELGSVAKAAMELDCPDLFEAVTILTTQSLPLDSFQSLGEGIGYKSLSAWLPGVKKALLSISELSERFQALHYFVSGLRKIVGNVPDTLQTTQHLERDLANCITETNEKDVHLEAADTKHLMHLAEKHGETYLFQRVLPLVKNHVSDIPFVMAFLTELTAINETKTFRLEVAQSLFKDILNDLIEDFKAAHQPEGVSPRECEYPKRSRFDYRTHGSKPQEKAASHIMSAENLSALFYNCETLGLRQEIDQLNEATIRLAIDTSSITFERVLLPLLRKLPPSSPSLSDPASQSQYTNLFRVILSSYNRTSVQPRPTRPEDWRRDRCGCNLDCTICVKLDAFLTSAEEQKGRFSMNGKNRDHLADRLKGSYCELETDKQRTPYTLVVTKTERAWEQTMIQWRQRCGFASSAVKEIGMEKLERILGDGWADTVGLNDLEVIETDEKSKVERTPLQSLGHGNEVRKSTTGKLEAGQGLGIVDLTCE